jgi:hypothetical protein
MALRLPDTRIFTSRPQTTVAGRTTGPARATSSARLRRGLQPTRRLVRRGSIRAHGAPQAGAGRTKRLPLAQSRDFSLMDARVPGSASCRPGGSSLSASVCSCRGTEPYTWHFVAKLGVTPLTQRCSMSAATQLDTSINDHRRCRDLYARKAKT